MADNKLGNAVLKVRDKIVEKKDVIKNYAIIGLAGTAALGWMAFAGASRTRDVYLAEKELTEDFSNWLTPEEE